MDEFKVVEIQMGGVLRIGQEKICIMIKKKKLCMDLENFCTKIN